MVASRETHGRNAQTDHIEAVVRAIQLMRSGLDHPQSLAALARSGMFSPFYFHRVFSEVTAVTPARFLAALRMAEACRLLLHSTLSVAGIGARVGYTSPGTFTTQFGRLVGLSPARFRGLVRSLGDERVAALLPELRSVPRTRTGATLALCGSHAPESLVVSGLLRNGGRPDRRGLWTVATGTDHVRLPAVTVPGEYTAFSVVMPARVRLVDALVDGPPASCLVGRVGKLRAPDNQSGRTVHATLRRPDRTDPPILAMTPVGWLIGRARSHRADAVATI